MALSLATRKDVFPLIPSKHSKVLGQTGKIDIAPWKLLVSPPIFRVVFLINVETRDRL